MATKNTDRSDGVPPHGAEMDTPLRPDVVTVDPTARVLGETAEGVEPTPPGRTAAEAEYSVAERRENGIEDNVRHEGPLGRR